MQIVTNPRYLLIGLVTVLSAVTPGCGGSQTLARSRASAAQATQHVIIRGNLVGYDGKPMKVAHVHRGAEMFEVDADGSFSVPVQEPGFHILRFTGVSHREESAGIYLDGAEVTIHARLGTYDRPERIRSVELVVMEPIYGEKDSKAVKVVPMVAQPDGSFIAEFLHDSPELYYELGKIADGRYINGTHADGYLYDGGGDYMSRVAVTGGKATVRFDPKVLASASLNADVRVSSSSSRTEAIAEIHRGIRRRQRAYEQMIRQAIAAQLQASQQFLNPEELAKSMNMDVSWRQDIAQRMSSEQDSAVKSALFISYFASSFGLDSEAPDTKRLADEALAYVPASSTLWHMAPSAAALAIQSSTSPGSHTTYVDELIKHLPDREIAGELVLGQLIHADKEERKEDMTRYYRMLTGRFSDTRAAFMAIMYSPDRKLRDGKPMPAFDWPAFGQANVQHSLASFRGKVVLVDFWATWCKPCIAEMPGLHKAYETYREKGFTILSVATGDDLEAVRRFRVEWPMPWNHVVLTPEQSDQVREVFGLVGLPMAVLLNGEGRIVATNMALRGENLMRTLANAINAQNAP